MAQVILQQPWALVALPVGWLLLLLVAWHRRFKPFGPFLVRLLIIVLLVLALAQPTIFGGEPGLARPQEQQVILVDQSASVGAVGRQLLRDEAARLAQSVENEQVLFFADQPVLVTPTLTLPANETLNVIESNLAGALTVAGQLLAAHSQPGRVVLLSDGIPTTGNTLAAAANLAGQNIPVDVLLPAGDDLHPDSVNEIRVVNISVPPVLRQGETFDIETIIHAERAATVTLNLAQDQVIIAKDEIFLDAGANLLTYPLLADEEGLHTFLAKVALTEDRIPENNSYSTVAQIYPSPEILIVADDLLPASRFAILLEEAGFETQVTLPSNLSARLSKLEPYAGMVLVDVSAPSFELEQMIAIQEFVRSLGRGLLVVGGRNSFGLGRYQDTPLVDLLPVSLEPPLREERPPVALLLVIDHSGSMLETRTGANRLVMAKEAAIRATDILGPDDLIGVLMFDNLYKWVVPFQHVNDGAELLEIQQRIARIPGGGGTRILQALEIGIPALIEEDTVAARHIVLLTDGRSFDGTSTIRDYNRLVDNALKEKITLSTIAIGAGADEQLLLHLAERGLGRYHFAETPEELPALTISESDILRSDLLQEGEFNVVRAERHPIVRGLDFSLAATEGGTSPFLQGYLAMTPKPQAEVALYVGPEDPLLSVWGYGLGRVVAWSSDVGDEWAAAWNAWPEASRFWGQVVGYTLAAPNLPSGLQPATIIETNNTVTLVADSLTAAGQPVDLAATRATLITPGGQEEQFLLHQVAPGRYQRQVRLPDDGAYRFMVDQTRSGDEGNQRAATGFVLPYPAEYALPPENSGPALLQQIAALTGGRAYSFGEFWSNSDCASQPENQSENCVEDSQSAIDNLQPDIELWPWLLQIALVLWPIEIAWRRWGRLRIN